MRQHEIRGPPIPVNDRGGLKTASGRRIS